MRHVIIGAGPAGVLAAENLRRCDPASQVMLIGDEPEPPYSRMAIPYLLAGKIDEAGTYLRKDPGHYDALGIEVRHARVDAVDTEAHSLQLADGASVGYDKLLIASGSSPLRPPVPGVDLPGVHPCWTLVDARDIAARTGKGSRVVLIGAGFIGCIILEALWERGAQVTVVELENRMVPRMMNNTAGGMIRRWCEQRGLNVHVSSRVTAIEACERGGPPLRVSLGSGESLPADIVITATGVRSNTGFLQGSTIELKQGILVDDCLMSNVPDVYAAGDVAQGRDFSTGGRTVQAIQPTAVDQARAAALNMARGNRSPQQGTVQMNVLDTLGLVSSSFAQWMGVDGGDGVEVQDPERFRYLNLQFREDVLVGATTLGLTDHVGVIRGLIQSRTPLGRWKKKLMEDPTRLMEAYLGAMLPVGYNAHVI